MSGSWIDIEGPDGTRRVTLAEGRTRLGAGPVEVELSAITGGELHVWTDPPKALHVGGGAPGPVPTHAGRPFEECPLRPGLCLEWGPYRLHYGGPAAPAELEELDDESGPQPGAGDWQQRLGRRVAAGALCEAGMADRKALRRWQEAVLAGSFEPDACARELLPEALPPATAERLLGRGGTLLRDFVMASRQSGMRGAARRVRERTRSVVAFVLVQAGVFVLFALIGIACMLVLRMHRGISFDALLDRLLPG